MRFLAFLLAMLFLAPGLLRADAPTPPNVIFILVDDMGWGDLGVFFQNDRVNAPKFATPNLDTMAAEGMQLRRHYCPAPVCAPSRASLLLGVTQGHANVRDNQFDKALENNHTLGTVMKEAGYATAVIGKWGLGGDGLPAPARPALRGFDYFFGYLEHGDAHFHYPADTTYGSHEINVYDGTTDITSDLDKCYSTDLFTARAKKWILDQNTNNPNQPFFLYLALTAPHARLDVPTQAYPSGRGEFGGLQWIGTPHQMINTASGNINSYIHPDYAGQGWPTTEKRHATMIRRIDNAVQDLIQTLKDRGIDDDTLIVFTSDNGPHAENGKGGAYTQDPTFFDSFGPMDGIKRDSWEAGIREPTLVRWPAHIAPGGLSNAASQFHDWMPTLAEVAGVPTPARSDGVSLLPTLTGTGTQRESTVYVEYYGGGSTPSYNEFEFSRRGATRGEEQVIFVDGYKGIRYDVTSASDDFAIYDTLTDPKESSNLANSNSYFIQLQQRMKDRVLQIRRPNSSAARPYDNALVPAVTVANTVTGLEYQAFEGAYPWVPDFTELTPEASGVCLGVDLSVRTRDDDIGLSYTGYLDVPADGIYTIYLQTSGKAFLRLHDAAIIDDDFGATGGEHAASVRLQAGKHPLHLSAIQGAGGPPTLTLKWSSASLAKQTIPNANLLRVNTGQIIAGDDSATAITETPISIDVLANDSIGSGPGPLSITSVTSPAHGVSGTTSGGDQIFYSSSPGYTGTDSFDYTITDGNDSATATVTIDVVPSIPPTANPDTATTPADTAVHIPVLANDSDDGVPSPLSISALTQPAGGSAVVSGSGIIYTPRSGVHGEDVFTYTITDGQDSATASVTVTVEPPTDVIWLPLDETSGTKASDPLGRSLGTLLGFPVDPWTTGHLGGALAFDGGDDHVVLSGEKGVTGTAARTVTFWVNADAAQTGGNRPTMVSWGHNNSGSSPGTRFDLNLTDSSSYKLRAEFNSSGVNFTTPARSDLRGVGWVHCAIVVPANAKVSDVLGYLDGVAATADVYPSSSGNTAINTSAANDVTLGRMADGSSGRAFKGMLDDVRIFPRALSAAEIAELAAQPPTHNERNQWYFQYTGNGAPSEADWQSDSDHDGLNAFLEFALGGNPTINSTTIQPVLTANNDFIFNRRREGLAPEDYVVETTSDLKNGPWQAHGPGTVTAHPTLEGMDQVTVSLAGVAGPDKFFVRLRVVR